MKLPSSKIVTILITALIVLGGLSAYLFWPRSTWNQEEIAALQSLWLGNLPLLAPDASNRYGDDPAAAALGNRIFFDTRFSSNGQVACATCHLPQLGFQDGKRLSNGVGITNRRAMPLAGTAYSPWLFWDGRKDSLWAQALGPLENPVEHGGNRTQYAHLIAQHYKTEYEAIFGTLPDLSTLPASAGPVEDAASRAAWDAMSEEGRETVTQIFANMGKSIAAYERRIMPTPARFDAYVEALIKGDTEAMAATLTPDEIAGAKLFIGKANCLQCHNGPLFTDNHFHNTGIPAAADLPTDTGRALGAQQVLVDEFNCLSPYSDASPDDCAELRYMVAEGHELERQYKPPSLRNVAERAPYMHAGQFDTLDQVLAHYNSAPAAPAGHSELEPLQLSHTELSQLVAFLHTLSAPVDAPTETELLASAFPLFALFHVEPGSAYYFAAVGLAGALTHAGLPLFLVAAQEVAPNAMATASGLLMGFAASGAGLLYIGVGWLQESMSLAAAMQLGFLAVIPAALLASWLLPRPQPLSKKMYVEQQPGVPNLDDCLMASC